MKTLKTIALASLIAAPFALGLPGVAQATDHGSQGKAGATTKATSAADMTEGEIKKVDRDNKKLTIKHGDIKNLDMPGMTMVFQVKEPGMLDAVKVGDKVRFVAEKGATGFVVAEIQVSK